MRMILSSLLLAVVTVAAADADPQPVPHKDPRIRYAGPSIDSNTVAIIRYDLRDIDKAKDRWAMEYNKTPRDPVSWAEISPFLQGGSTNPPVSGRYELNPVGKDPEFSLSLKELEAFFREEKKRRQQPDNPPEHEEKSLSSLKHALEKQQAVVVNSQGHLESLQGEGASQIKLERAARNLAVDEELLQALTDRLVLERRKAIERR